MGLLHYIFGPASGALCYRATLVRVLRSLGTHAFDLPDVPASAFASQAEALAQRLELETQTEHQDAESHASVVAHFIEKRLRAENEYVGRTIPGLRNTLFEVVRSFSDGLFEGDRDDVEMAEAMDLLAQALEGGTAASIRAGAETAIRAVKENLRRRQRRNAAQLDRMGQQLKEMQARMTEAEAKRSEDKLTGLPNRAALDERLDQDVIVAHLTGDPFSVLMLDVDHFKRFNDTYGHAAGDLVLESLGDVLVQCFPRRGDFAARYGGEEFCVLLPNTALGPAERLAERFRKTLRDQALMFNGQELRVTCSVGVAQVKSRESAAAVRERADAALYAAKRGGRDRVVADRQSPKQASF